MTTRFYITEESFFIRFPVRVDDYENTVFVVSSNPNTLYVYLGFRFRQSAWTDYEFSLYLKNKYTPVREVSKEEFDALLYMKELVGANDGG